MPFELPSLPYGFDALEPHVSAQSLRHHHDQHRRYLTRLNAHAEQAGESLEDILLSDADERRACAIEAWNHTFFWHCLSPWSVGYPADALAQAIGERWGSLEAFQDAFEQHAMAHFSSGWTWLVKSRSGALDIINTREGEHPLCQRHTPLLLIDMWEHAYYLDYRGDRYKYLQAFWHLVNWEFVAQNFES